MKTPPSFLLLTILAGSAFCQQNSIGLFAGPVRSDFRISGNEFLEELYQAKGGFAMGGHFTYALNQPFGIRAEFVYQKLGACQTKSYAQLDGAPIGLSNYTPILQYYKPAQISKYCDILTYLELPVMLQAQWGNRVKFRGHLGQSVGYLVKWNIDSIKGKFFKNERNRFSYSILAGLGVTAMVTEKIGIQINGRATSNLTGFVEIPEVEAKNVYLSGFLGVEYFFD